MSPFQVAHQFKARYGVTPGKFRQAMRLRHAKRLLLTTPLPVREVARRCGYRSHGSFSDGFRIIVGCSPSEYRASRGAAGTGPP